VLSLIVEKRTNGRNTAVFVFSLLWWATLLGTIASTGEMDRKTSYTDPAFPDQTLKKLLIYDCPSI
jgi:hypothetical protein